MQLLLKTTGINQYLEKWYEQPKHFLHSDGSPHPHSLQTKSTSSTQPHPYWLDFVSVFGSDTMLKFLQEYWWFEHLPGVTARYLITIEEYNFNLGIFRSVLPHDNKNSTTTALRADWLSHFFFNHAWTTLKNCISYHFYMFNLSKN